MGRRALHATLAVALLLAAGIAGLLVWVHGSLPPLGGEQFVDGVQAGVRLERDARGRLTVWATSREDLAFGLGYAHGQDRFFQMDLLRRAGEGTLAALIGGSGVRIDQGARRHDLAGTARAALAQTTVAERAPLESYARGVNAGLASLRARPWEYLALRQTPRPWRVLDTFHVVLAMYRDLQDETNRRERALDIASRTLDPAVFAMLTAGEGPWEAPVEGGPGQWPRGSVPPHGPALAPPADPAGALGAPAETEPSASAKGSNAWAVDGSLTADGRALLANDMHLGLSVPAIWYAARLVVESDDPLDAVGVTLAGTPALVVGSNGHIAWGFTNSYGDWLDHVVLELDPADSTRYRDGSVWRRLVERRERIEVAGGEPVDLEVRQSVWGPVVGTDTEGRPLALRWTAQDADALDLRMLAMVEQKTVAQALDLAPRCGIPHQNFVVASRDGEIGWTILGRVPRRVGLDGPRPQVWGRGRAGWFGWLDSSEVPRITEPSDGRLWTANARVVGPARQRVLGDGGYAIGARAKRIRARLFAREEFDEQSFFEIQFDTRAELMETWRDRLRALATAQTDLERRADVLSLLDQWTGEADANSVAYRFVREWRAGVTTVVLGALGAPMRELAGEDLVLALPRTEIAVSALLRDRPGWVPGGFASWTGLERACLDEVLTAWGDPAGWPARTWGERNAVVVQHPISSALPSWLAAWIDLPSRPVSGDVFVPRVDGRGFGASQRLVVAPGAEERGILQMPGGPRAHPMARGRADDFEAWAAGEPVPLLPGPTVHTRILRPAAGG